MLFLVVIFLGAFLLFQIQPLIAKIILPYFGGGAAVWTACLLFFQAFLLLGYLYAHLLSKIKSARKQLYVHASVLTMSLFCLPIGVSPEQLTSLSDQPLWSIISLLSLSIGLPYLLLSSTGPIVQRWLSLVQHDKLPYKLYSLSNFASLLALLSFPFLVEPLLTAKWQSTTWTIGFVAYVVMSVALLAYLFKQFSHKFSVRENSVEAEHKYKSIHPFIWLALATVGVVMLVSTTNAMTQNIPPVPFLWVLPLSLYLLSFIVSFHNPKWYVRWYWLLLFIPTGLIALFMFFIGSQFDITSQIVLYSSILFAACMICHGELSRLKPSVDKLTFYYLMLAFGGFLGSVLVAFVAQNVFSQFLEFPLAIIAVFTLLAVIVYQEEKKFDKLVLVSVGLVIICGLALWQLNGQYTKHDVYSKRNFYGILSVKDVEINGEVERRLIDGTTSHGTQYLSPDKANIPLSYYRENTGVALLLQHFSQGESTTSTNLNVALIGLGAGTLAAYGQPGDSYRFYELNPSVIEAANGYFSYLKDSKANIEVVTGDGRVSLSNELEQGDAKLFDVLVIDAFSGDSIPQHLLTLEAMELYWQRLQGNGAIAVHISNTHLNLLPLMQGIAESTDKALTYFRTKSDMPHGHDTEWVWLTNNSSLVNNALVELKRSPIPKATSASIVWTDDYSNLLSLLK